jgi:alpha-tubulin suppressor-like RCC1 family protein
LWFSLTGMSPRRMLHVRSHVSLAGASVLTLALLGALLGYSAQAGATTPNAVLTASSSPVGYSAFTWGDNATGQLGNRDGGRDSNVPVAVDAGASPGTWLVLAAGGQTTCGVGTDNQAYCWGYNGEGQVGNGTTVTDSEGFPGSVLGGPSGWRDVGVGWDFACGLGTDRRAYCWGGNLSGQLGNGTRGTVDDSLPAQVLDGANGGGLWDDLKVDYATACGIRSGAAYCWGGNGSGQLGNGTKTDDSLPVAVLGTSGPLSWRVVDPGGRHTCGITADGDGFCWGSNFYGQLGNGVPTISDDSLPAPIVSGPAGWKTISAGDNYSCGVGSDDTVYCWGANSAGQLGNGTPDDTVVPVAVNLGAPALTVSTSIGGQTTCATTATAVYCWGLNSEGQLGNGPSGPFSLVPVRVVGSLFAGLPPAIVAVGGEHVALAAGPKSQPQPISFPPSAPADVTAEPEDASATVAWKAPTFAGSFPITNYQVAVLPGGGGCLVAAPATTCTVTGLTNGTTYTAAVRALNGAGWGPYSAASGGFTPRTAVTPAITISGTRGDVRGKPGIIVTGMTQGFSEGAQLRPWTRFPGQTSYTMGISTILVSGDGGFTWQRRTGKKIYVTVRNTDGTLVSNRVVISRND